MHALVHDETPAPKNKCKQFKTLFCVNAHQNWFSKKSPWKWFKNKPIRECNSIFNCLHFPFGGEVSSCTSALVPPVTWGRGGGGEGGRERQLLHIKYYCGCCTVNFKAEINNQ